MIKSLELSQPLSCLNRAADDELLFVLLGRDVSAPAAIRAWVNDRLLRGKNIADDQQIREALDCADRMEGKSKGNVPLVHVSIPWRCSNCRKFGTLSVPINSNVSDMLTLIANQHGICEEQLGFSVVLEMPK